MSASNTKHTIKAALESFQSGNLSCNAINLFKVLGYNTERQAPFEKQNYDSFESSFVDGNSRFNEEKALVTEWKYVDLLFQISHEEITKQYGAFKKEVVTKEDGSKIAIESFLFFAIELKSETYSRSTLSHITREVNKLFPMPAIVLFKHGLSLTLAIINRRLHKRDESKDVLEKVTFIKDINIEMPHRAHIEILFDLSFEELLGVYKFTNFVELHSAWQKTLDTKELNNKFYKELSNWYFWAMDEVYFPGAKELGADKHSLFKEKDKEKEHNAENLIRLLTRLLFVWFVKEKGLIPEEFFDEKYVADELLINFKPKKDRSGSLSTASCYYRAILQNLFFATLNQNMGKREFRKSGQHMNVTNLLRYERYFKDSNKYIKLVEKATPFMNGGLFECLDIPDPEKRGKQGGDVIIYQDGFSDRDDNQLKIPDYIFFGTENHVDLSEAYGDKAKEYKNAAIKGLINILKSYKFTVAENTPLEEEVALDPELLGRVFENLLASYNPETKTTARKQTGSFYTPRDIVNYMVDESLITYLKQKLEDASVKGKEVSIRDLISYSENPNPFNAKETTLLIDAIDSCKIIDPACGSGAFPMGILHKLVHILHKLDPRNELWEQKQIEKARAQDDPAIRDQWIADVEAAFENNELDYGRKLYLIENCIYGVDIQPIATQISKLRFFISLIVDQKVDGKKDNFGIRPLPNLETKFVAANTLIGIQKPEAQINFGSVEVKDLERQLKDVRHRLFSAKTPATKRRIREEDKTIRGQMGNLLIRSGWKNGVARQLAGWDPYDQNASSSFFDPEWMFGIADGFDVVIGNPPYIFTRGADFSDEFKEYIAKIYFAELAEKEKRSRAHQSGKINLFALFILRGLFDLKMKGVITYIVPNNLLRTTTYDLIRKYILVNSVLSEIVDLGSGVFENVTASTIIFRLEKKRGNAESVTKVVTNIRDLENHIYKTTLISQAQFLLNESYAINIFSDESASGLLSKVKQNAFNLSEEFDICAGGIATGPDKTKSISAKKQSDIYKPLVEGKDVKPYILNYRGLFIEYDRNKLYRAREESIFLKPEKLITQRIGGGSNPLVVAYDNKQFYTFNSTNSIYPKPKAKTPIKYILAVLNSKVLNWLYSSQYSNNSCLTVNISKTYLDNLPIPKASKENIAIVTSIVDYILFLKIINSKSSSFFERLIDAIVYELYLPIEIKASSCEVLKYLASLPELKDCWGDERKLTAIEEVYNELSGLKHPVSVAMFKMQEIEEVRIIEGKA